MTEREEFESEWNKATGTTNTGYILKSSCFKIWQARGELEAKKIMGLMLVNEDLTDRLKWAAEKIKDLEAQLKERDEQKPVAKVIRNLAGQIVMQDGNGGCFDISQYVGAELYAHPVPAKPADVSERVAQLTAHRACHNQEQDVSNGKLAGYCVICGVPWPCEYASKPADNPYP